MTNPLNPRVRAIVRREYLQRVRSKWFLVVTLGIPLLVVGLGAFSGLLIVRAEDETVQLSTGLVDRTGRLSDIVVEELLRDSIVATRSAGEGLASATDEDLRTALLDSGYDVFLVLPAGLIEGDDEDIELLAKDNVPGGTRRQIREGVNRAVLRVRLADMGVSEVDPGALLREASLDVTNVTEEGGARSQRALQALSMVIALMFYMVLIFYGQMIVRSVIEEKNSDIVEVMVSSVRPWELMLGKIVGVGAVGLTQIAIWLIVVGAGILYGLTAGQAMLGEAGVDLAAIEFPVITALLVVLFLVFGYLLYAGLFAGAGATVSNEHDSQQVLWPVVLLIIVPFIAAQGVVENPNTLSAVVLSLVPFFSPLLMPTRLLVSDVPVWEIAIALLLLLLFILLAAWVAGRIYRIGILMKGKRPNLPELVRWVRHG